MTTSTPDELIVVFPHSSLPKVTEESTYEDLKVIQRLLNTNDTSVASYEGGGRHGHLGIITTNEEYFAVVVDVFHVPNNPGPCGRHDGSGNRGNYKTTQRGNTSVLHLPQRRSGY
jgi:hypothetical protein